MCVKAGDHLSALVSTRTSTLLVYDTSSFRLGRFQKGPKRPCAHVSVSPSAPGGFAVPSRLGGIPGIRQRARRRKVCALWAQQVAKAPEGAAPQGRAADPLELVRAVHPHDAHTRADVHQNEREQVVGVHKVTLRNHILRKHLEKGLLWLLR